MDGERTAGAPEMRGPLDRGRVGIIDVGSNSIRLVVYERASRAPLPVFNEKVLCGLARGLDATGRLNPEGVEMALVNIDRFMILAHNMKVTTLDLVATAAVRDAVDGADFMREIASRPGIVAHTVSGQDEARFSAYGVICGMPDADGVMGDLGGGSLELAALGNGRLGASSTLPVGPLRLMSSGRGDPKKSVVEAIESVRWLREEQGKTFYAVGGAWRAFARLHMEQAGYPLHIIHQYEIPVDEARAVARLIAVQSAKSLEKMPGVSRRRVDTLPLACLALDRLLGVLKPRNVVFSAFGLREGFYYSRLSAAERARHPLIAFAEEQGAGWRRFDLSPQEIFDWLIEHLPPRRMLLIGEVDGVFSADPQLDPTAQRIPLITPAGSARVTSHLGTSHGVDVTGGMLAKVQQCLAMVDRFRQLEIVICSGLLAGNVQRALAGDNLDVGTVIRSELGRVTGGQE